MENFPKWMDFVVGELILLSIPAQFVYFSRQASEYFPDSPAAARNGPQEIPTGTFEPKKNKNNNNNNNNERGDA